MGRETEIETGRGERGEGGKGESTLVSLLTRTSILSYGGPTLMSSFNLGTPLYAPVPDTVVLALRAPASDSAAHNSGHSSP